MPANDTLEAALKRLQLLGLLAAIDEIRPRTPGLARVLELEGAERTRRSLAHRTHLAGLGAFKPLCDFDWKWPKRIDRVLLEEILTLRFIAEGANVILLGPNGVGKTMLLRQRRPSRPARWSRSGRPLCQRSAR